MRNLINGMEKPTSCHTCLYFRIDFKNVEWCVLTQKDIPCDCPFQIQLMTWTPVTERLPERFETVIICGRMKYSFEKDYCRFVDVACFDKPYKEKCQDKWSIFNDWYEGQQEFEITHWMSLPKPPID